MTILAFGLVGAHFAHPNIQCETFAMNWKMIGVAIWTVGVVGSMFGRGQAAETATKATLTVEGIQNAWQRNSEQLNKVQYVCQTERTGSILEELRKDTNATMPKRKDFTFSISGNKAAMAATTSDVDPVAKKVVPQIERTAFDGKETRTLSYRSGNAYGRIVVGDYPAPTLGNSSTVVPIWLSHSPLRLLEWKDNYNLQTLRISNASTKFDGRQCIELSVSPKSPTSKQSAQLIVDPALGFRVVRLRESVNSSTRIEHRVEYTSNGKGVYTLSGWQSKHYSTSGKVALKIIGKVAESSVNVDLEDSEFQITFPKGARVLKADVGDRRDLGTPYRQIDEKGTLKRIQKEPAPREKPPASNKVT